MFSNKNNGYKIIIAEQKTSASSAVKMKNQCSPRQISNTVDNTYTAGPYNKFNLWKVKPYFSTLSATNKDWITDSYDLSSTRDITFTNHYQKLLTR